MSALYEYYSKVDGESAFLIGVVSTLSDEKLNVICPPHYAIETDVFKAKEKTICKVLKQRLYDYANHDEQTINHINRLEFELKLIQSSPYEFLHTMIGRYGKQLNSDEKMSVDEFFQEIKFQIGDIKALYNINGGLNEQIKNAISDFYLFIVLDILFVQYKDYIVMLIFGSDE